MSDQPSCKKAKTEATNEISGDDENENNDQMPALAFATPVAQQNSPDQRLTLTQPTNANACIELCARIFEKVIQMQKS